MMKALGNLFNWKKHPESIFPLVIPLAILALACNFTVAVLQLTTNHDPWYLVIFTAIIVPGGWAIYTIAKRALTLVYENERRTDSEADQ